MAMPRPLSPLPVDIPGAVNLLLLLCTATVGSSWKVPGIPTVPCDKGDSRLKQSLHWVVKTLSLMKGMSHAGINFELCVLPLNKAYGSQNIGSCSMRNKFKIQA